MKAGPRQLGTCKTETVKVLGEQSAAVQSEERWEDFLPREIAGSADHHDA
jgi:hypothetical protein